MSAKVWKSPGPWRLRFWNKVAVLGWRVYVQGAPGPWKLRFWNKVAVLGWRVYLHAARRSEELCGFVEDDS